MLTLTRPAAILDVAIPRRAPLPSAAPGRPRRAVRPVSPEERRVEQEQDARFAQRRAALQQRFAALPAPGTPAYWSALADSTLPMEVLVRCLRNHQAANDRVATDRIFELVLSRMQTGDAAWAAYITRVAGPAQAAEMAKELRQELHAALWRELTRARRFIEENFQAVLARLRQHVAHPYMQQEGLWIRKDVTKPERVPRQLVESLTPPATEEVGVASSAVQPADPQAEAAFDMVELAEEVQDLLDVLPPQLREQLWRTFAGGQTQAELAAHFDVTDRTIRLRHEKALGLLRAYQDRRGRQP